MAVSEAKFRTRLSKDVAGPWPRPATLCMVVGLFALLACDKKPTESEGPGTNTAEAKPGTQKQPAKAEAQPLLPPEKVQEMVNPKGKSPYSGPTGSVRGRVVAVGDPPPPAEASAMEKIPASCQGARETYGRLFREGMQRSLADVLVAVTGYDGYVPARNDSVTVEARGCAWNTRTVVLTYGQQIGVISKDDHTYVPELLGQSSPVQLFATPRGDAIKLTPREPGRFVLLDSMRLFNTAEVYVLPYATFDVTGLEGTFQIDGLPPGTVKVNALLPMTGVTVEKEVTVEAGKTIAVDLELPFDQKAHESRGKGT